MVVVVVVVVFVPVPVALESELLVCLTVFGSLSITGSGIP